mmetsp:Transcript_4877/g.8694  ORF Transcript_4877/g.8694 Transcript_4877/m.8694 type:complete len:202 (-) Transcript_4877:155-760(-)
MGASGTKADLLRREEVEELEEMSGFAGEEILELYRRFRKLDRTHTGTITRSDLLNIPELSMNPLADRVVDRFQFEETDGRINFEDFVRILAVFADLGRNVDRNRSTAADEEQREFERLKVLFDIFDKDGDNAISSENLYDVFKSMVGNNMEEDELREIVGTVVAEIQVGAGDRINFDDFRKALQGSEVSDSVSVLSWRAVA